MIIFIDKGLGLVKHLADNGYNVEENSSGRFYRRFLDGAVIPESATDTTIQALIDGFDELPFERKQKRKELNDEYLNRLILIYPDADLIDETVFDFVVDMSFDVFRSVIGASRLPNADWQNVLDTRTAKRNARTAINALTNTVDIQAYDVVNTPAWPVM